MLFRSQNLKDVNRPENTDCFEGDSFVLSLKNEIGQVVTDSAFCSSYGLFEIDAIDLNGDDNKELVFVLGEGRGTSARKETLYVYELTGSGFKQLSSIVYSDYYGSGKRWWYERHYRDIDGDGKTDLELILFHDPIGDILESPELIPTEKRKVLNFGISKMRHIMDSE